MQIIMVIPDEIIVSIVSILITYLLTYWGYIRKREKLQKQGYESLKEFLGNIFIALCNSNGYGETFKKEYEKVTAQKEDLNNGYHSNKTEGS